MTDVLRAYDAQKMSMTTEMTSIPSAFPMNKCVVTWTVSAYGDGKAVVTVRTEMAFTGSVGKGGGMPGPGEPPFVTYDGMESFWRGAYDGWIHAGEQIAVANAAATAAQLQTALAAEDAFTTACKTAKHSLPHSFANVISASARASSHDFCGAVRKAEPRDQSEANKAKRK